MLAKIKFLRSHTQKKRQMGIALLNLKSGGWLFFFNVFQGAGGKYFIKPVTLVVNKRKVFGLISSSSFLQMCMW